MSIPFILLVVFNIFIALGLAILWIRQFRPAKEDPRLSRGLQLLQSKISVLEDLSDRTEVQVKQLTRILDERAKNLQAKMLQAEETVMKIEGSMRRSLDVAEIFQDKIPHEEIIERNQQTKYVLAAKLANEGYSVDEILGQVDLPRSEVELIAKVNREELTFNTDLLPEWAKNKVEQVENGEPVNMRSAQQDPAQQMAQMMEKVFQSRAPDLSSLERVEQDFKRSVREAEEIERLEAEKARQLEERAQQFKNSAAHAVRAVTDQARAAIEHSKPIAKAVAQQTRAVAEQTKPLARAVAEQAKAVAQQTRPLVQKVQFPRITVDRSKLPQTIKDEI